MYYSILLKRYSKAFLLFIVWISLFLSLSHSVAKGGEDKIPFSFPSRLNVQHKTPNRSLWQRIETRHVIIQYVTLKDLEKFDDNIDYSPDGSLKSLFSSFGSKDLTSSIVKKVDALFERVQEILDMHGRLKKVTINLYPNKKQFHKAYYYLTGTRCPLRAWYIFESNTIYINVDDVFEGMLAHEMAHAVVDHYLSVRPPTATAEILARYVNKHLLY
ncbi:MAG TPA: hypothetical protein DDW42_09105 [Desulfobacteraceae bacterium]|nr:hypothetical protein [Desulfobacteraceae bacterium]